MLPFTNVPETPEALVPEFKPQIPDVVGADQENCVPSGTRFPFTPFVGTTLNEEPEQISTLLFAILIVGATVTVTSKLVPVQFPASGVIVYTTSIGAFVLLVNVPVILEALVPDVKPVIPVIAAGADHE